MLCTDLCCFEVLQGEVPQLRCCVQQQELKPCWCDTRSITNLAERGKNRSRLFFGLPFIFDLLWLVHQWSDGVLYLLMSPAWMRSWARSWLTAALGEPTMKWRMTSQRSMAYRSRLSTSLAWRSGPRLPPSSAHDLPLARIKENVNPVNLLLQNYDSSQLILCFLTRLAVQFSGCL